MNENPIGSQAPDAIGQLFEPDTQTTSDRALLRICQITGFVALPGQGTDPFLSRLHGNMQKAVIAVLVITLLIFIATLCLLGIRSVGRQAGKRTLFTQTWYVLARVTLYLFLPCTVLTLLMIAWAILTHQPAFR